MPQQRLKKFIGIIAGIIFVALAALLLVHYLHTGTLVVTSTKNAVIQVTDTSGKTVAQGTGKLTAHLTQGTYTLAVGSKALVTNKPITIHGRQTLTEHIMPTQPKTIEPVTPGSATSVTANATHLQYIDSVGVLQRIDDTNHKISLNNNAAPVLAIAWADSNFGAMIGSDGVVYTIDHGSAQPLSLTIPDITNHYSTIAVTPDHHIYVSQDNYLYFGDESGFSKIYTTQNPIVLLKATGNAVAVLTNKTVTQDGQAGVLAKLMTVTPTGNQVGAMDFPTTDSRSAQPVLTWSPNGKLLAVSNGGPLASLYNNQLQKLVSLPTQDVTSMAWQDNDTLYFSTSKDSLLWQYSRQAGSATGIANATTGNTISDIAVSDDHASVYFTVTNTDASQSQLERISLTDTNKSSTVYQLGFFFPATLPDCSVSFVNFTQPTLFASYTDSEANCKSELLTILQQDDLAVTDLRIEYAHNEID